jgi:hypothetical protein
VNEIPFFKTCDSCLFRWGDLNDFLGDPEIKITGYQANFDNLSAGTFLFSHSCGIILELPVRNFNGLYEGPIFRERAKGADECPDYCLYQDQLDRCQVRCECAYVRDIIYVIKNWPKY